MRNIMFWVQGDVKVTKNVEESELVLNFLNVLEKANVEMKMFLINVQLTKLEII